MAYTFQAAEELNEIFNQGLKKKNKRYYYNLLGLKEFEKDNLPKATEHIKEALPLLSHQSKRFDDYAVLKGQPPGYESVGRQFESVRAYQSFSLVFRGNL